MIVAIDTLKAHKRNYNKHPEHQVKRLTVSLRKFGQRKPITTWRNTVLTGHGVFLAAQQLAWKEIDIAPCPDEWTEEMALAWLAADNELARLADPDLAQLAEIIEEARNHDAELLEAIGFDEQEFAALLESITVPDGETWGGGFAGLPTEDRAPFQQMTFTLHDTQAEQVKRAITAAQRLGDFADSPNQNGNGNALALICETFVTEHGNG